MTWKELKDKISHMTEEEQLQEVAVWGEDISIRNRCCLSKTHEAMYYSDDWDECYDESNLDPEDFKNPDIHKVCESGTYYIFI